MSKIELRESHAMLSIIRAHTNLRKDKEEWGEGGSDSVGTPLKLRPVLAHR